VPTRLFRQLSLAFAAGGVGVIALVVFLWIVRDAGVLTSLGLHAPKPKMPDFLYSRIVWGGLWALLFVLPVMSRQWLLRGLAVGVLASLASIFYFNPAWKNAAFSFVLLIFVANAVWGIIASGWYRAVSR
jgi:hypothetical protein